MPNESGTTVAARLGSAFDKVRIMPDQRSGVAQKIVEPQRDFDPMSPYSASTLANRKPAQMPVLIDPAPL